jgi:hypothetical protein
MEPRIHDAVLGGNDRLPAAGALVLGTGKLYGKLFDRFNAEAKACNENYLRLELAPLVALVRKGNAMPLDEIKVKVWYIRELYHEGKPIDWAYWSFAGYLRHDGPLWVHTAKYDPTRCDVCLRPIAEESLRGAAQ